MQRLDLTFNSGGQHCAAWLYLPESATPAPVLAMAHGLGGTRGMRLDAFAERFCDAGYACLVFDYRHFGASEGEPRQLLSVKKQLEDWKNAVAFLKTEPRVNSEQIILWGTSFSGGHVLKAGADLQDQIAGVISQCPFTNGLASSLALNPLSSIQVTLKGVADVLSSVFKKEPVRINLAGKPGQAALMTAPDVMQGYNELKSADDLSKPYVAARFAFDITRYFPGLAAKRIVVPALVIACLKDSVAPVKPTLKYAQQIGKGTLVELETGHFDIYVGQWFEKNLALQLSWLNQHFPVSA